MFGTAISTVLRDLPRDVDPPIIAKADTDQSPILSISLSGPRSQRELTEIADKIVKTQIERSPGVGEVNIIGGLERAINVWVDSDRLAAYQLPITAVRDAVERQNANMPGGNVTGSLREQTLRTMGRLTNAKAFNDLVIATRNGSPIRVRDIGWAEDGTKEQRSMSRLNGHAERHPGCRAAIRREHRCGHRRGEAEARGAGAALAGRRQDRRSFATNRATFTRRCTRSSGTSSWGASLRAWWSCSSCATGGPWSSRRWPFPPPSSPPSA